jgi:transcription initiation factor TFIIIB Brf1 subunit/transcription initiation factor TFIIB
VNIQETRVLAKTWDQKCPECGSIKVITDVNSGEIVCGNCGFVMGPVDYAPPPEREPRIEPKRVDLGTLDPRITTFRISSGRERLKSTFEIEADRIRQHLGLSDPIVVAEAYNYARRFEKEFRSKGEKTRLTHIEKVTLALWAVIKKRGKAITMDEYERIMENVCPGYRPGTLFKLMKTAAFSGVTLLNGNRFTSKDYVPAIITKIEARRTDIPAQYMSHLERLALRLVEALPWIEKGRDPVLVAAAAIHAADVMLAELLMVEDVCRAAEVGALNVKNKSIVIRRFAPPLTPDELRIRHLFRRIRLNRGVKD